MTKKEKTVVCSWSRDVCVDCNIYNSRCSQKSIEEDSEQTRNRRSKRRRKRGITSHSGDASALRSTTPLRHILYTRLFSLISFFLSTITSNKYGYKEGRGGESKRKEGDVMLRAIQCSIRTLNHHACIQVTQRKRHETAERPL